MHIYIDDRPPVYVFSLKQPRSLSLSLSRVSQNGASAWTVQCNAHWRNKFGIHVFNYFLPFMLPFNITEMVFFCSPLFALFINRIMVCMRRRRNRIRGLK